LTCQKFVAIMSTMYIVIHMASEMVKNPAVMMAT